MPQEVLAAVQMQLVHLRLKSNSLIGVPPEIARLSTLTLLDLSYNALKSVPASLGEMTSDKPAVYARGAARMEAQPAPMNSKERKRRQLEEVDAYLSVIDEFGAPEEARFY